MSAPSPFSPAPGGAASLPAQAGASVDAADGSVAAPFPGRVISSAALLQGSDSVYIDHAGALYQLRATRQGKLILTK